MDFSISELNEMHAHLLQKRELIEGDPKAIEKVDAQIRQCKQLIDRYWDQLGETALKPKDDVFTGPRGGRYTEDVTKDGRPYRRYF